MLDASDDALIVCGLDGKILFANRAVTRAFGWPADEVVGSDVGELLWPQSTAPASERLAALARTGDHACEDLPVRCRNGSHQWFQISRSVLRDQAGRPLGVVGSAKSIADEKELEKFFALSPDLLCVASTAGYFVRVNPAFTDILGWSERELVERPYAEFVHPDDRAATEAESTKLAAGGTTVSFENRFRTRDGQYVWFLWKAISCPEEGCIYAAARDINARKEAEQDARRARCDLERRVEARTKELHQSEQRYRDVFEHAPLGIAHKTLGGVFLSANHALADILGYESPDELLDVSAPREVYVDPADREALLAALDDTDRVTNREVQWRRKDGHIIWVRLDLIKVLHDDGGAVRYLQVFVHDITNERTLQDQLQQSQKMEAVGTLAGSIAHDFNNLLTPILSNAEFLMDDLEPAEQPWQDAKEIRDTARRAMALTRQILTFGRKQLFRPTRLDLSEVVSAVQPMLKHVIRENVRIRLDTADEPRWVETDRGQLEQVLLNLVINARDAMPAGGEITIETSEVHLDEHYTGVHAEVEPGRYGLLAVSDTGHGMDEETRRRVFEPFFTTKGPDRGTGLGLSTVYAIVRRSGGHVQVYSEPGQGTVFRIYLPASEAWEPVSGSSPPARPQRLGSAATVLVVEDDARVRTSAVRALRAAGYRVLEAEDGETAMETLRAHLDGVQLLLTDVVMPGMSGVELAREARALRPELAVVFLSGYTEATALRRGILAEDAPFLQKPFTPAALQRKVSEVLEHDAEHRGPEG
ncbi:MAG: PAS domain S-box protein [Polyangiales bacterium]